MTPPDAGFADQVRALRFWDGRGTVRLVEADIARGAMLLERLAMHESLLARPVAEAIPLLGQVMRRLAVAGPSDAPSTTSLVRDRIPELESDWHRLREPFDRSFLAQALETAVRLSETDSDLAANGDLHSAQVLRGEREPWLTVDPVLMRGDIECDLARVLWTRIDEMRDAPDILEHFDAAVVEGTLDRDRARNWVLFRAVDYWLWGLDAGLTEDPPRCARLSSAFAA